MKTYLDFNVDKTVRLHGRLSRYVWSRLYYYIKSLSTSGYVKLKFSSITELFKVSNKTLYRWLLQGFKDGAFRFYKCKNDTLSIFLGSKYAICKKLNLSDWGGTIEVPARQLLRPDFYSFASQIQTIHFQRQSIWAAIYENEPNDKDKKPEILNVSEFFKATHTGGNAGKQKATSSILSNYDPFKVRRFKVRHIIDRFALTCTSFVKIGASQKAIGESIGITDRSVRNHLTGINRFQLCHPISKREFIIREQLAAENWQSSKCFESSNQFWEYGCNLYDLNISSLKSEHFQRLYYEYYLSIKSSGLSQENTELMISKVYKKGGASRIETNPIEAGESSNHHSAKSKSFKKFLLKKKTEQLKTKHEINRRKRAA